MPAVNKIDSNVTGLAFAEEAVLGSLPGENGNAGTPVWNRLEPNSYSDFGGETKTVAPNPLNPSRQRRKGIAVDVDAMGGFNHNWSFTNMTKLFNGLMFAATREKGTYPCEDVATSDDSYELTGHTIIAGALVFAQGFTNSANNGLKVVTSVATDNILVSSNLVDEASPPATATVTWVGIRGAAGDLDVVAGSTYPVINSTALDFTDLGLVPGQWIYIGGDSAGTSFTTAANNGFKRIRSVSANQLVLDKSTTDMVTEASTTETIDIYFGDVIKNELGTDIIRYSYQVERTLGVPNTDNPSQVQSELLIGAVASEATLNIPQADLVNWDFSFMAINATERAASTGPKQSSVVEPLAADIFNSSSDVPRMRMSVVSTTNENPSTLFAFATEATVTFNNNVSIDKAIGVYGGFDMTVGTFEVGGSATVYFSDVAAITAVRTNDNVSLDFIFAKNNQGYVVDLPLISLGDGRLTVEQDQSIKMPLSMDAATAKDIDPNLDYTVMFTIFNYLPTVAS